ncbi:MAG: hypothetical protein P8Z37_18815 [Acidobacteriota bacterium]
MRRNTAPIGPLERTTLGLLETQQVSGYLFDKTRSSSLMGT